MTVATTISREVFVTNSVDVAFSFNFKITDSSDLVVTHYDANDVATVLAYGSDFTLNAGPWESGGTVTTTIAQPVGTIVIKRDKDYVQGTKWPKSGAFPATSHENAADNAIMLLQQLKDLQDRAMSLAENAGAGISLELPSPGANLLLGWAPDGLSLENKTIADLSTTVVSTFMSALLQLSTALEARDLLDAEERFFYAHEAATPDMTVLLNAGRVMYGGVVASQAIQTTSTITAPTTNPRIDRIVIDEQTGAYSIVQGDEAVSPIAKAIPTGKLANSQFQLETTTTTISNSVQSSTNALIVDERFFSKNTNINLEKHGNLARYVNLVIKNNTTNPTYQVDIDADYLEVDGITLSSVNLTADITASGVNGLDTGSEALATWYHLWVINDGATTAALFSLSDTWAGVDKTNISGYDFAGYVGAIYNNSTGDFFDTYQIGNEVFHVYDNYELLITTAVTTYTGLTLSLIPSTAKKAFLDLGVKNLTGAATYVSGYVSPFSSGLGGRGDGGYVADGQQIAAPSIWVPLATPNTVYYQTYVINTQISLFSQGWSY